jgi:hypothetical protein
VQSFADANDIPVIKLKGSDRKIDIIRRRLDRAAAAGRSRVAAIGVAQEVQNVFTASERSAPNGVPWSVSAKPTGG